MKFLRKSVTVTARYCLLFIVYKKYDLRQPEDISGKELSGGILLHTEIPPFYVDVSINQMIISKNPQFTGISARQQLEFTTHLLLTD